MTIKNERPGAVPQWIIERLAAGDLPPDRAVEVQRRLIRETDGAARLAEIAASNVEILAAHPPAQIAAQVRARADRRASPPHKRVWQVMMGGTTVLAAALIMAVWARPTRDTAPRNAASPDLARHDDDGARLKGLRPTLRVYRQTGEVAERLQPDARTHAGDRLQLAYVAAGRRFGAVLSVDGAGQITYHLPAAGGAAARLRNEGEVALADAYELDAAPGFERFVFVSSDSPFDTASLLEVLRGNSPAPAGTSVVSFTVRKE